eukprot:COSAG01_NODE_1250_length_11058_cov_35.299845_4_plen_428_part_00
MLAAADVDAAAVDSSSTTLQEARRLFAKLDRDGSKTIDGEEFLALLVDLGKVWYEQRGHQRVQCGMSQEEVGMTLSALVKQPGSSSSGGSRQASASRATASSTSGKATVLHFDEFATWLRTFEETESRYADRLSHDDAPAEIEVPEFILSDKVERARLFKEWDENGSGNLSLAELDKQIVFLWPQFNNKKALLRAFAAADVDGSGYITRKEFRLLLKYIVFYNKLWAQFREIDANEDGRLDEVEFAKGCGLLGLSLPTTQMSSAFREIDTDGSGHIHFKEFCTWAGKHAVQNDAMPVAHSSAAQAAAARRQAAVFSAQCSRLGLTVAESHELVVVHGVSTVGDLRLLNAGDLAALGYEAGVVAKWLAWNDGGLADNPGDEPGLAVAVGRAAADSGLPLGLGVAADDAAPPPRCVQGRVVRSPPRRRG